MKPTKPATISEIIAHAKRVASGVSAEEVKEASVQEIPSRVTTPESDAMRQLAASLRNYDFEKVKLAALKDIIDGNMPSKEVLQDLQTKTAFVLNIERGESRATTVRNVAAGIRQLDTQIKEAAQKEAFKQVRGFVAAEKLNRYLNT